MKLKNMIKNILASVIAIMTIAWIVTAIVPPPPVNQNLSIYDTNLSQLVEQNCRNCHNSTFLGGVPTRHHNLVAIGRYGCTDCHPSTPGLGNGILLDRNCIDCHNGTTFYGNSIGARVNIARPHHINTTNDTTNIGNPAANRQCNACHGSFVDNYNDGHYIPTYNESDITPGTKYKVFNATSGRYWGGCFACHQSNATVSPNILSNKDNHHGEILGASQILSAVKVATAPTIDGVPEVIWDQAPSTTINVAGGANTGSAKVTLKSIYTNDSVYFLAVWNDPTQSDRRLPWQKQANGSWKQLTTPGALEGGEETFYEDKFAQIWNMNISSFGTEGCFATCHAGENSDIKAFGNKYTQNGNLGDIWHMKTVRTNPTGYIDDQYVDSRQYSITNPDAGRHSDPGTAPYFNNINGTGTGPNYTSADQPAPPYWIFDNLKQPFNDTYNVSDEIAGIVIRPPTGDRADILAKAVYSNGNWTMEYGRKLLTGSTLDVQFSDLTKGYYFGTAVFDNAQTRHNYESSVTKLVFLAADGSGVQQKSGTPGLDCKWCHGNTVNTSDPLWLDIRACEQCHSVQSIHNIQYNYSTTKGLKGYGHVGENWDCLGCHAWYNAGDANPFAGAIIPDIFGINPSVLTTGQATTVTIVGSNFVQANYTTIISVDGANYTPTSVTDSQIAVTVPALTAGSHTIQAVKGNVRSKLSTLTVVSPVTITSAKLKSGIITIAGTGFGTKPTINAQQYVTIAHAGKIFYSQAINSWIDTQISAKADNTIASVGDKVTVTTVTGAASARIK